MRAKRQLGHAEPIVKVTWIGLNPPFNNEKQQEIKRKPVEQRKGQPWEEREGASVQRRRTLAHSAWPANLRGTHDTSLDRAACAPGANIICPKRSQADGNNLRLPESPLLPSWVFSSIAGWKPKVFEDIQSNSRAAVREKGFPFPDLSCLGRPRSAQQNGELLGASNVGLAFGWVGAETHPYGALSAQTRRQPGTRGRASGHQFPLQLTRRSSGVHSQRVDRTGAEVVF